MTSCSARGLMRDVWKTVSRRKSVDVRGETTALKKCLTVVDLTCLGVANVLGTGIYVILGHVSRENAGPSVILSFLIAAVASFLAGLCYAELGSRFSRAGSAYVYAYATLGELAAFTVGWSLILELAIGGAVAAKAWIHYIDALTNNSMTSSLEENVGVVSLKGLDKTPDFPAFCLIVMVTAAISISVKAVCVFNNFLTIVGFLVIAGMVFVGLFNLDIENWTRGAGFFAGGVTGMLSASAVCCYAFVGYDVAAMGAGEAHRHGRTLATAIICAFLIGLFASFTMATSSTLLVPFSLFTERASLMHIFEARGILGMKYFVVVGAFTGLMAAVFASLFGLSRLMQRMAADGLLFAPLERVSSRTGSPWTACLTGGSFCSALALVFDHGTLVGVLGVGTLLASTVVALAVLYLRYSETEMLPSEREGLLSREDTGLYSEDSSSSYSEYVEIMAPVWDNTKTPKNFGSTKASLMEMRETAELLSATTVGSELDRSTSDQDEVDTTCIRDSEPKLYDCPVQNSNDDCHSPSDHCDRRTRQMAVEYVNNMFVSSIMESVNRPTPTSHSSHLVAVSVAAMMGCMTIVAILTVHRPEIFVRVTYWPEVLTCFSLVAVIALLLFTAQQPKHSPHLRHKLPCFPALPLGTIWVHVQLFATLSLDAWLRSAVWSFMGFVIYALFSSRHSKESLVEGDEEREVVLHNMVDGNDTNLLQQETGTLGES